MTDHTPGFVLPGADQRAVPCPSRAKAGAHGLFLIQTVMDELRYVRGPSENVLITLKDRKGASGRR